MRSNNQRNELVEKIDANEKLGVIVQCSDFKKKVAFRDQKVISYLSKESTVQEYLDIIIKNNGKEGSDKNVIEKLMEITKFTTTISQILSQSPCFIRFTNTFFDEYQNCAHFAILCNNLKEIILKICDENASFFEKIPDFLQAMPKYTDVSAIMELLVTIVNYHPSYY